MKSTKEEINELNRQDNQDEVRCPINVSARVCFGYNSSYISMIDKELNNSTYKDIINSNYDKLIYKKGFDYNQVPVGYEIHNVSNDTIKNIALPKYKNVKGRYTCNVIYEDLEPNKYMYIPTFWLMLLLLKLGIGLEMCNGKFVSLIQNFETNRLVEQLSNMTFYCDWANWNEYFQTSNSNIMIGHYVINTNANSNDDIKVQKRFIIIDDKMKERFGYLLNLENEDYDIDEREFLSVIEKEKISKEEIEYFVQGKIKEYKEAKKVLEELLN